MARIAEELSSATYLKRIIVALGQASESEYRHARSFFDRSATPVTILQVDHPRILRLFEKLKAHGLDPGPPGKGRSCWLAYGYVLAGQDSEVIALHDCDIRNYSRSLLARLCYPLMNPALQFDFCKGYYARHSDRLHGRVTRLFLTPLVRAMQAFAPSANFLRFVDSFRYALAGEFSMRTHLAALNQIPADWGLEVGVLAEIYRNCPVSRVCQTDLTDSYDHKHQALSPDNPGAGLRRMSCEIARSLLRTVASEGIVFGADELRTLQVTYVRSAEDMIRRYRADAIINGLQFDQHAEQTAVHTFAVSLRDAAVQFLENPLGAQRIPSWTQVEAALPLFFADLQRVVAETDTAHAPRVAVRQLLELPLTPVHSDGDVTEGALAVSA
jgi:glucosyl-3-phosphoglycerate synthase